MGDVNDDDLVDIQDITLLIEHVLNSAAIIEENADIDHNGTIDIDDVVSTINIILGLN
jgi:hypothetical protein